MITQQRLKELVKYIPETGEFFRDGRKIGYDNGRGYLKASIDNKEYYLHRLAWLYSYGEFPELIDHKDQNKSNNKIENLRAATNSQNLHNRGVPVNNKSGHKGVHYIESRNKYLSSITINSKQQYLGIFKTIEEAVHCRKQAEETML